MLPYNISDSTLWIVVAFLLITLLIGLWSGRNVKTFKDYALGTRPFSSFSLALTFLATWVGGQCLIGGGVSNNYKLGIVAFLPVIANSIRLLLAGLVFSNKIVKFNNIYTPGDLMEKFYGKKVKLLTGIMVGIKCISYTSTQFIFLGVILKYFFQIDELWGIIIGGAILSLYSILGGINSVTKTDMFHFFVLIIIFPIISGILIHKVGGFKNLLIKLPPNKLKFIIKDKIYWFSFLFYLSFSLSGLFNPAILQRVILSKNSKQVRNQFFNLAFFNITIDVFVTIIGLSIFVLLPKLKSKEVVFEVVNIVCNSNILKGIIISGFLAIVMSTADSYLHAIGLVFFRDIFNLHSKLEKNKILPVLKLVTLFISILTLFLALFLSKNFYYRQIVFLGSFIAYPLVLFPYLIGILGIKTNIKSFIYGAVFGSISSIIVVILYPNLKPLAIIIGMLSNAIAYLSYHIFINKGIAWIERDEEEQKTKLWIPEPKKITKKLISFIPTPKKIYNYSRFQVMKNGSENMIFGIYCCVNFTLPYFLWDHQDPDKYNLMTNLRFIGGIMAGLLIVKDEWKKFLKPYYPLYWHATLTYCLPFITTIMFLLSGGSLLWLIQVAISIFFLIMLVAGEVFLILAPLGISLGLLFYKYFVGPINIFSLGFDINYYLIYAFFFPTIIGLLFAYKKKIFNKETSNIGINLGLSLCHEIRNTLSALSYTDMAKRKMERIEEMSSLETRDGEKVLIIKENSFKSVHNDVDIALGLNQDSVKVLNAFENLFIEYKKSNISLQIDSVEEIVRDTLNDLHFLPGQLENIHLDLRDDFFIQLPKAQFAFVLSNIIRNAFKHGGPSKVEIKIENNKLIIRDNGKGIPESDTERIFQMHYTTGKKGDSSGIGLWFSKIIITSFNGEIKCNSQQGENSYTEFIIKFPEIDPSKITEVNRKKIKEKKSKRLRKLEKEEIAIKMLEGKKSIKEIEEYTNLTRSQIEEIKKKL